MRRRKREAVDINTKEYQEAFVSLGLFNKCNVEKAEIPKRKPRKTKKI